MSPITSASRIIHGDEITVLDLHGSGRQRPARGPLPIPNQYIEAFVIEVPAWQTTPGQGKRSATR